MKLGSFTEIKVGINSSRMSNGNMPQRRIYGSEDLQADLTNGVTDLTNIGVKDSDVTQVGDVVTTLVGNQLTAVVCQLSQGLTLNQNFAKITFDIKQVNPYYLSYLLNEAIDVKKQKLILKQGSIVPKITPQMLREIEITLPSLAAQEKIGKLYYLALQRQHLTQLLSEQEFKYTLALLNQQ